MQVPERPPQHIVRLLEPAVTEARRSPIRDYKNQDHWWRLFPNANSHDHSLPIGSIIGCHIDLPPAEALEIVVRHHEILEQCGIANPNIEMYFSEGPQGPRLFSLNEHVTGADGIDMRFERNLRSTIQQLGASLLRYADQVEQSKEDYMLWDIHNPNQYIYGTTPRSLVSRMYLIDTDPFLSQANALALDNLRFAAEEMGPRLL